MTDTIHVQHSIAFIQWHELAVVKQALKAMRDCIDLKLEIRLPVLPGTRAAIEELDEGIHSLKLALLRSPHPGQPMLPGMENLSPKEGSRRGDMAS